MCVQQYDFCGRKNFKLEFHAGYILSLFHLENSLSGEMGREGGREKETRYIRMCVPLHDFCGRKKFN